VARTPFLLALLLLGLSLSSPTSFAAPFIMPATPPRPLSSPPAIGSPPTSPQRHQQAVRQQERFQRSMGSPEQRRIPATPRVLFPNPPLPLPPSPPRPVSAPVTFNGRTFNHLPADLVARLSNMPPPPAPFTRGRRRRRGAPPLPVCYFWHFYISLLC
jgi:hypothetical protein